MLTNKIIKLRIENFRGLNDLEINFNSGNYFVLAGKNGVGKTSILEAINYAFSSKYSKFTEIVEGDFCTDTEIKISIELNDYFFLEFDSDGYKRLIPCKRFTKTFKRRQTKERGEFFSAPFDTKTQYFPANFDIPNAEFRQLVSRYQEFLSAEQKIVRKFRNIGDNNFGYSIASKPDTELEYPHIGFQYFSKTLFPICFYLDNNRERELQKSYSTTFSNVTTELEWRYKRKFLESKKTDVLQKVNELKSTIDSVDDHKNDLLAPANEILRQHLLKNDNYSLDFHYVDGYKPYSGASFGIENENEQLISCNEIGSGNANLLSLALSISFARESKNPAILLIDEPELHLEAGLQKNLSSYLKGLADFHVILSTHSHLFNDPTQPGNNFILDKSDENVFAKPCDRIDLSDLHFRLLGNSLSDLYIPKNILLVEGKYDKRIIEKCLKLYGSHSMQIIPVGGKGNMPGKSEAYKEVLDQILSSDNWYFEYIVKVIKILVDGDVSDGILDSWVQDYNLNKEKQIKKIDENALEYLYPRELVDEAVVAVGLRDGTNLADKSFSEIIKIILDDDKVSVSEKDERCAQIVNRLSKDRLCSFVAEKLTKQVLEQDNNKPLFEVVEWIT